MANREEVIMVSLVHQVICPNVEWKVKIPSKHEDSVVQKNRRFVHGAAGPSRKRTGIR